MPFDSSTVTTPSLPTFSITSPISSPIVGVGGGDGGDLRALLARRDGLGVLLERARSTAWPAASMPRLIAMGLAPAATFFSPSWTIAWPSTVAVVVPSPAMSLVLEAISLASWAPMFSNGSSSSMSLAMVTPSLVMVGAPNFLSSTTLRPLGPRVILTASARASMPRIRA